eukprot:751733-Hanusia_phi.AAC.1
MIEVCQEKSCLTDMDDTKPVGSRAQRPRTTPSKVTREEAKRSEATPWMHPGSHSGCMRMGHSSSVLASPSAVCKTIFRLASPPSLGLGGLAFQKHDGDRGSLLRCEGGSEEQISA